MHLKPWTISPMPYLKSPKLEMFQYPHTYTLHLFMLSKLPKPESSKNKMCNLPIIINSEIQNGLTVLHPLRKYRHLQPEQI